MPTFNDVVVADPVLTGLLVAYQQSEANMIAGRVFPNVSVPTASGTFVKMTKKYWFTDGLQPRAAGDPFIRVDYGTETDTYKTIQYAGDEAIADEERANSQLPLDLEGTAIDHLGRLSLIRKEIQFAADFMKLGVWGTDNNNAATDWDDAGGDPIADIVTASGVISAATGFAPNTLVVGEIVHRALMTNAKIRDTIRYVQQTSMSAVRAAIAAALGVENYLVSTAIYNTANEGQTATYAPVIDDDALLLYVNPAVGPTGISAGKTFVWQPGGGSGQIFRYRDNSRHAEVIQHKEQWDQKLIAAELGYFFSDIV